MPTNLCKVTFKICYENGWVLSWSFDGGATWTSLNFGGAIGDILTGLCENNTLLGEVVCIGGGPNGACPTAACCICRSDKPLPTSWVVDVPTVSGGFLGQCPPGPNNVAPCSAFTGIHLLNQLGGAGACQFQTLLTDCCYYSPDPASCYWCNKSCLAINLSLCGLNGFSVTFNGFDPSNPNFATNYAGYTTTYTCPLIDCTQVGKSLPPFTLSLTSVPDCFFPEPAPCCNWPGSVTVYQP